ncbi:hypothetical protein H9L13_07710 [Sphingomonas lutea]|uniref:Uncharacterized protein n=1 Tax=Sphingomonas lutea TaxID=1045317 RepID=A0A7G9SFH4_9SPHN|nr:hypothetical protein [Sphingomonas lutea]QNN66599.1 hypothetical protein H9L13_07710 [Sphingomonas lutea]
MSMSIATPLAAGSTPSRRILLLTVLFGLFSYAFLAMRGAMVEEEWAMLLSLRRAIAVAAGAGAYWMVLKKLETLERIELGKVIGWIIMATLAILVVRLATTNFRPTHCRRCATSAGRSRGAAISGCGSWARSLFGAVQHAMLKPPSWNAPQVAPWPASSSRRLSRSSQPI